MTKNETTPSSKRKANKQMLERVKQALRQPYAWPGGYPIQMFTYDGRICHKCVRENFRSIVVDTLSGRGGWAIQAVQILWEGKPSCVECGEKAEPAYVPSED